MRAQPTGKAYGAADPDGITRRDVFAAALAQAEELADAAETAGYASRPLPLFYMLSQAGRAIAAAYAEEDWQYRLHGITPDRENVKHLSDRTVKAFDEGAFPVVCAATNSATLHGKLAFSALWASLPELSSYPRLAGQAPRCIELMALHDGHLMLTPAGTRTSRRTWTGPHQSPELFEAGILIDGVTSEQVAGDRARQLLDSSYPSAAGFTLSPGWFASGIGQVVAIRWLDESGVRSVPRAISLVADSYDGAFYLRPGIDATHPMPSGLMTWWAILFLLSTLARYEPAGWTTFLDNDHSLIATELQGALDLALDRVPLLLVDVLRGAQP